MILICSNACLSLINFCRWVLIKRFKCSFLWSPLMVHLRHNYSSVLFTASCSAIFKKSFHILLSLKSTKNLLQYLLSIYVTRSDKRGLLPMTGSPIFSHKNECTIRFQCHTWPVITDLLLLAAYSWPPSSDLYEQSGVFMAPWEASSELWVSWCWIKACGVDLPSF